MLSKDRNLDDKTKDQWLLKEESCKGVVQDCKL